MYIAGTPPLPRTPSSVGQQPSRGTSLPDRLRSGSRNHDPIAVLDFQQPERGKVEAQVIARRHGDDPAGADIGLGPFDLVAQLAAIEAAGALGGLDQNHQSIIGVAAKCGDGLPSLGFKSVLVADHDWFLPVAIRQLAGDQQRGGRQTNAIRGGAGKTDELFGGNAVTLIERVLDPELPIIAGDNRWALPEARADDRLDTRRRLDLRELRGHV